MLDIKLLHVSCVILSITGFFVRGLWMIRDSEWLANRWVRVVPHIIDTVLLVSAVLLVLRIQQYPLTHDWLTAKVVGLLAYIGLGMVALRPGRGKPLRVGTWLTALMVFAYIVAVAVTRQPFIGLV
jgi:uncharacterized membrane protein SirB2